MYVSKIKLLFALMFFALNSLAQLNDFGIEPVNDFSVEPIEPANWNNVGQYEKLEFRLTNLPPSLQQKIDNFLIADVGDLNKTDDMLNPFMEWDIDVEATFSLNKKGTILVKTVDGFFSREYIRDSTSTVYNDTTLGEGWDKVDNSSGFYVRVSLPEIGKWNCTVSIEVENGKTTYSNASFDIEVIPSSNLGFMKVGSSGKYFTVGGKTYNPVGQNLIWPGNKRPPNSNYPWMGPHKYAGPICYDLWEETLDKYALDGGNYYRILLSPTEFDIEYELLGNYNNRLHYAQEIDNTIEHAENNDLKIHFCMMVHFPLMHICPYETKDWFFNDISWAYSDNYQLNLNKPSDFLTDSNAILYWQQRLRYIISRWGYSTSIGAFQLLSEINSIGDIHKAGDTTFIDDKKRPYVSAENLVEFNDWVNFAIDSGDTKGTYHLYHESDEVQINVKNWHYTMADYIKNVQKHTDHLICASYASSAGEFDSTHSLQLIDFVDENRYRWSAEDGGLDYEFLYNKSIAIINEFSKPYVFSETGTIINFENCGEIEWLRTIWMGAMLPTAGSFPWEMSMQYDLYKYLGKVKTFKESIDLNNGNFISNFEISSNELVQSAFWKEEYSTYGQKSIGIIDNRTINHWTTGCPDSNYIDPKFMEIINISGDNEPFISINTDNYTNSHRVDYYDPLLTDTDGYIKSQVLSSGNGSVPLEYPETNYDRPFILFKVYPILSNENDKVQIANVNGQGNDELVLNNRGLDSADAGAFRSLNLQNNTENWVDIIRSTSGIGTIFDGWFDIEDKLFYADVVATNPGDEIILVNRGEVIGSGAIMVVSPEDGTIYNIIEHDGSFAGWLDDDDKMFVGDVNNDSVADLILVNTNYVGGAIRSIDLLTGNKYTIWHPGFDGWMDAADYMDIGDVNGDGFLELIMVNTSGLPGQILAVQINNGEYKTWFTDIHINLTGWVDPEDKWAIGDVNNDGRDDLVLINATIPLNSGAIRAIDLLSAVSFTWIMHGGHNNHPQFAGWLDECDKVMLADRDGNGDQELILVNMSGNSGFVRIIELDNSISPDFSYNYSPSLAGWLDINDRMLIGNVRGNDADELVLVNYGNDYGAFLSFDFTTGLSTVNWHCNYTPSLDGWKDGVDESTNYISCEKPLKPFKSLKSDEKIIEEILEVNIQPNPSSGVFNINIIGNFEGRIALTVSTLQGKTLINKQLTPYSNTQIDLSMHTEGTYIATFRLNNKTIVKRLVKTK